MRTAIMFIAIAIAIVFALASASAQEIYSYSDTFVASTVDTVGGGGTRDVITTNPIAPAAIWVSCGDSIAADVYVDYRKAATGDWLVYADSIIAHAAADANSKAKGIVLRGGDINRIPGATELRVRFSTRASPIGVTTPTLKIDIARYFLGTRP